MPLLRNRCGQSIIKLMSKRVLQDAGADLPVKIDRLLRCERKSIGLVVERDGSLTVRAPKRAAADRIAQAVRGKADWILRKQALNRERMQAHPPHRYLQGEMFEYLGGRHPLALRGGAKGVSLNDAILVAAPGAAEEVRAKVIGWYKKEARRVLEPRLKLYCDRLGVSCRAFRLSGAKARWGSCSTAGSINLNWRLIAVPLDVIDYVAAHEAAHLLHPDHSAAFWQAVGRVCPGHRAARDWLREHQALLGCF